MRDERDDLRSAIHEAADAAIEKALASFEQGKRGWDDEDFTWLLTLLKEEVRELTDKVRRRDYDGIMGESVDVINYAAFLRYCAKHKLEKGSSA